MRDLGQTMVGFTDFVLILSRPSPDDVGTRAQAGMSDLG